jgi:hypothetical protein
MSKNIQNIKLIDVKRWLENIEIAYKNDKTKKKLLVNLEKVLEKINDYLNN